MRIYRENILTKFLWWCSGAEVEILRKLPSEAIRYSSIGITVIIKSIFAIFSGAFIFYYVFQNITLGVLFGVILGLVIFTIDRYVVSMAINSLSRRERIVNAIPQIIISLLFSILITAPLSLSLFQAEINNEIARQSNETLRELESSLISQREEIKKNIDSMRILVAMAQIKAGDSRNNYYNEISGIKSSGRLGIGPVALYYKEMYEKADIEYRTVVQKYDSLNSISIPKTIALDSSIAKSRLIYLGRPTFIDMLKAYNSIRLKNNLINAAGYLILMLMALISIAPIMVQIMSKEGLYIRQLLLYQNIIHTEGNVNTEFGLKENIRINKIEENWLDVVFGDNSKNNNMNEREIPKQGQDTHHGAFQRYFSHLLRNLDIETEKNERKAKKFFWLGLLFNMMGIVIAFGFLVFWLNYLTKNNFQSYTIFQMISGTLIILLVELLGAWFLKQHKSISSKSYDYFRIRENLDRYFLIYLAINDMTSSERREAFLSQLIAALDKSLNTTTDNSKMKNESPGQEVSIYIDKLNEAIKSIGKFK
jgi:hypothetical protein